MFRVIFSTRDLHDSLVKLLGQFSFNYIVFASNHAVSPSLKLQLLHSSFAGGFEGNELFAVFNPETNAVSLASGKVGTTLDTS